MTNATSTIFYAKQEDDSFLAVSIDTPRFCVGGKTLEEAEARAQHAVKFYNENKHKVLDLKARETRVVTPAYEERELLIA